MKKINLVLSLLIAFVIGSGCYYYEPQPYIVTSPPSASYDQIWDTAIRAAQDVGIRITSSNRSTGTAYGQRDGTSVTLQVTQQPDGRTRVELTAKGSQSATSAVTDDFNRTYNRYMGR